MSIPRTVKVTCPKCKSKYDATIFDSINTDFSPDVAESIMSGKRFRVKCPSCGYNSKLEYDVLYHDLKHNAMIWVVHPNSKDYNDRVLKIRFAPSFSDITRIVSSINELREKVACLESGVDDRIVEICKLFLKVKLSIETPDFITEKSYYAYSNGNRIVYFYNASGEEKYCYLNNELYAAMSDANKDDFHDNNSPRFQIIDEEWATQNYGELIKNAFNIRNTHPDDNQANSTTSPSPVTSTQIDPPPVSFCRKCGARLLSDSLFCSYCGTKVLFPK